MFWLPVLEEIVHHCGHDIREPIMAVRDEAGIREAGARAAHSVRDAPAFLSEL